ncbi:MAG: OadG family transporter subunit [Bacteroidales bacterium]|nr:OadG family transporter subunit [Bacteroidales bacterium]
MIATITPTTWQMTAVGIGVVFAILIILVLILNIFTIVAKKTTKSVAVVASDYSTKQQAKAFEQASEQDKAAVAVALYLYFNDAHDLESGVLTHTYNFHHWRRELNPHL